MTKSNADAQQRPTLGDVIDELDRRIHPDSSEADRNARVITTLAELISQDAIINARQLESEVFEAEDQ